MFHHEDHISFFMPFVDISVRLGGKDLTPDPSPSGRGGVVQLYSTNLSYSACVPIQNQTTPSGTVTPSARYWSPIRTDQNRPTCLKCSEGWRGLFLRSSKFSSASFRMSGGMSA